MRVTLQYRVLQFLKARPGSLFDARGISQGLGEDINRVRDALRGLDRSQKVSRGNPGRRVYHGSPVLWRAADDAVAVPDGRGSKLGSRANLKLGPAASAHRDRLPAIVRKNHREVAVYPMPPCELARHWRVAIIDPADGL